MIGLRRVLLRVLVLLLLLFAGDRGMGLLLDGLRDRASYPPYVKVRHMLSASSGELICLGNSRCENQYVATILADSLALPTFNAGISGGESFVEAYWMLSAALGAGQVPAGVIVDVSEPDLNGDGLRLARMSLDRFAPWYGIGGMNDSLFARASLSHFYVLSRTLRHYYGGASVFQGVRRGGGEVELADGGYAPLEAPPEPARMRTLVDDAPLGELQRFALEGLMADCEDRGIPLVLVVAPSLMDYARDFSELSRMVGRHEGVQLINYQDSGFLMHDTALYYNENHLWDSGARVFSRRLARDLRGVVR